MKTAYYVIAAVFAFISTFAMDAVKTDPLALQWAILFMLWTIASLIMATRK